MKANPHMEIVSANDADASSWTMTVSPLARRNFV